MKKLLLILLMSSVGISTSLAQSIRTGATGNMSAASTKSIRQLPLANRSMKEAKAQTALFPSHALKQDVTGDIKVQVMKNVNADLNPIALYMRPQGYFKAGLTPKWEFYQANIMLGHAYEPAVWRNLSLESDAYLWKFENPDGSGTLLTNTEENLEASYPYNLDGFEIPILTATGGGQSSIYQWGVYDDRLFLPGGNLDLDDGTVIGVGNYDLSYNIRSYTLKDEGGYAFGTTTDNSIEGVANYFEKPVHKYVLTGVWAALGAFSFPAGTEFTMVIHRIANVNDPFNDEDIIATATCTTEDVEALGANEVFTMPFRKFVTIDPETGLKIETDYLEIEDAILIEIKGFNNIPGSEISFCVQEIDQDPIGENNAYLILAPDRSLGGYSGVYTSLLFNLEATYSFLFADSDTFTVPAAGGEKTFNVTSFYSPDEWWLEEALPEWLSDDFTFDSKTWDIQYTLSAEPLPANTNYREALVKIVTFGADMSILVQQGITTGLSAVPVANVKVVNENNGFELSYTPDYSVISVYNVAGQKVAGYQLPVNGTFIIPNGNYPKGVYLFTFTGTKGASTVKVMK